MYAFTDICPSSLLAHRPRRGYYWQQARPALLCVKFQTDGAPEVFRDLMRSPCTLNISLQNAFHTILARSELKNCQLDDSRRLLDLQKLRFTTFIHPISPGLHTGLSPTHLLSGLLESSRRNTFFEQQVNLGESQAVVSAKDRDSSGMNPPLGFRYSEVKPNGAEGRGTGPEERSFGTDDQ
jgi:hypothetical protein